MEDRSRLIKREEDDGETRMIAATYKSSSFSSDDDDDVPLSKRPRTETPRTETPKQQQRNKSNRAPSETEAAADSDSIPNAGEARHPSSSSSLSSRVPAALEKSAKSTVSAGPVRPRTARAETEAADVVMEGTEESDRSAATAIKMPATGGAEAAEKAVSLRLRKPHKLQRLRAMHGEDDGDSEEEAKAEKPAVLPSEEEEMRAALRRSLVLALNHVGFSSASNAALESFCNMTEKYLQSLAEDVARFAFAARRSQPIPTDFDAALARFNLRTSALRPHLRNPVAASRLTPTYFSPPAGERQDRDLPLLSRELSGKPEKEAKPYIPAGFPDFPSIHTYRNTPVDVDSVTVRGSGLRYDDGTPLVFPGDDSTESGRATATATATVADTLAAGPRSGAILDSDPRYDPKRIREVVALEAKQAEEALRGLMRASKINKLKEVRAAAERSPLNRQRFSMWELAMRELIQERGAPAATGGGASSSSAVAAAAAAALREEIADQSMMVDSDAPFYRKEITRISKTKKQKV